MQTEGLELVEQFVVHRDLHHGGEHDASHPQRENRVERSHGTAVVLNWINSLAIDSHRRREGISQTLGILADNRANGFEVVIGNSRIELVLDGGKVFARIGERRRGIAQNALEIVEIATQ